MDTKTVIWDWNGTLLDDVQYAIDVRNRVFPRFGLPQIDSVETYHEQFTFPVKLYYQRAGMSDADFQKIANAWMDEYIAGCRTVPLFDDALFALDAFTRAGYAQVIVSASKTDTLREQLEHAGIADRFQDVRGLSHIYATDKTHLAKSYLADQGIDPASCVLLGDTVHDAMVADSLGMDCVLIARGHMSGERLQQTGHPVCASLSEAAALVLGRN